jgi:hypothetical protein
MMLLYHSQGRVCQQRRSTCSQQAGGHKGPYPASAPPPPLRDISFLRVGNDTNGTNLLGLRFDGQDEQGVISGANDQGRLAVDFGQFGMIVLLSNR